MAAEWRTLSVGSAATATPTTKITPRITIIISYLVSYVGASVDTIVSVDGIAAYVDVSVDVDIVMASTTATVIRRSSPIIVAVIIVVVAQGDTQCCRSHCRSRHAGRCTIVYLLLTRGGIVRLTPCRQSQCEQRSQKTL